jgi:hypothetical protein
VTDVAKKWREMREEDDKAGVAERIPEVDCWKETISCYLNKKTVVWNKNIRKKSSPENIVFTNAWVRQS